MENHELKRLCRIIDSIVEEQNSTINLLDHIGEILEKTKDDIYEKLIDIKKELSITAENNLVDSFVNREKEVYVYFIESKGIEQVKIGISNNPEARKKALQTAHGCELEILHTIRCNDRREALDCEHFLHKYYSHCQKKPYGRNGSTEWFSLDVKKSTIFHLRPISYFDSVQKIKTEEARHMRIMKKEMKEIII